MKVAGRKSESAWFLTNKKIQTLNEMERGNLATLIGASDNADAAFNALLSLKDECGLDGVPFPASKQAWCSIMIDEGIPHQIWFGRLSWTTYSKVGDKYVANYQGPISNFAKDLRRICKTFFLGRRQLLDIGNHIGTGNVGNNPDGNKLT